MPLVPDEPLSGKARKEFFEQHYQESYDRSSANYDEIRWKPAWGRYLKEVEDDAIRELLPLGPGTSVLDVAAGTGRASFALAANGPTITGIDISEGMLAKAEARRRELGLDNVSFHSEKADALSYPDNHFDAVMSIRFLHLIPKDIQPVFIAEMKRVLKPGGWLLLEWSNQFDGLVYGMLKDLVVHHLRGKAARGTIRPGEIRRLMAGLVIEETRGISFPGAGLLWKASPSLARTAGRLGRTAPFCYTNGLILVRARKPRDAD